MTGEANHGASHSHTRWNRLSVIVLGSGIAALLAAAVLFVLTLTGTFDDGPEYSRPDTVTAFGNIYALPSPAPTATPAPVPPSDAPVTRILIPKVDVDAPISVKGVDTTGVMENPDGAWDVAWYDFSARPGFGSNAVFSGHVDYIDVGPAVFWRLGELVQEDLVEVLLEDGTVYQYHVVAMDSVDTETVDIGKIVGATEQELVTLITCIGTFDPNTGQYDQRLIVRAERITSHAALQPPPNATASP